MHAKITTKSGLILAFVISVDVVVLAQESAEFRSEARAQDVLDGFRHYGEMSDDARFSFMSQLSLP